MIHEPPKKKRIISNTRKGTTHRNKNFYSRIFRKFLKFSSWSYITNRFYPFLQQLSQKSFNHIFPNILLSILLKMLCVMKPSYPFLKTLSRKSFNSLFYQYHYSLIEEIMLTSILSSYILISLQTFLPFMFGFICFSFI